MVVPGIPKEQHQVRVFEGKLVQFEGLIPGLVEGNGGPCWSNPLI